LNVLERQQTIITTTDWDFDNQNIKILNL